MRKIHLLFCLALLLSTFSCKYKLTDRPNWDSDFVAPLLKSSVSLEDALTDSTIIEVDNDNNITLVLRDTVADFVLSDFLEVPDTSLETFVTLDSIRLPSDTLGEKITLGQLIVAANDPDLNQALALLGNPFTYPAFLPPVPGLQNLQSDPQDIDAAEFFQDATLLTGYIDIKIQNKLPVDLDDVQFALVNAGDFGNTDTVLKETFLSIPKNTTASRTVPMAGKMIESHMIGKIINLNTSDIVGGTFVDTASQYVQLDLIMRGFTASYATAVFPTQTVLDAYTNGSYNFGGDIAITKMEVEEGIIIVKAKSTINDTLEFSYELPTATKQGQKVLIKTKLNPAPIGGEIISSQSLDLHGYNIDLTLDGDSVNTFPQHLKADLKYSGNLVTMTLQDTIRVEYQMKDIIPTYVEGYLGKETLEFQSSVGFDFFNSILGGTLDLPNAKMDLVFTNSVGVDGLLKINKLEAFNRRTNQSVSLQGSAVDDPISIPGPRLPNVGQSISSVVKLSNANSNIDDFFGLMPDSLDIDIEVIANVNGTPSIKDNFATIDSRISAIMDLEVPLYGSASNVVLQDTLDLDLSGAELTENVTDGSLNLVVDNYFPFEVEAQIYFFNDYNILIDSLFKDGDTNVIPSGLVGGNGIVEVPTRGTLSSEFDRYRLDKLRDGRKAVIKFGLTTKPDNQYVKILSTYSVDFTLVGDFNYKIGN